MSTSPGKTTQAAGAVVLIGALALAGCGTTAGNESASPTTAAATQSMAPSPATQPASPSPGRATEAGATSTSPGAGEPSPDPTSPAATPTHTGTPAAQPIPDDALDYADALIVAWGAGDQKRMATLAAPSALNALREHGDSGGPHWKQAAHDAGAGSVFVRYKNSRTGATVELRIGNEAASKAQEHAVAEVHFTG